MKPRYVITPCPTCGRRLSVNNVDIHRPATSSAPDSPDRGSPLRSTSGAERVSGRFPSTG